MASGWKGIAMGGLGLAAFEVIVTNQGAAGRVGGIFTGLASGVNRFISPEPVFGPVTKQPQAKPAAATTSATQAPATPYPPANAIPDRLAQLHNTA